jgi:hypothetical protein
MGSRRHAFARDVDRASPSSRTAARPIPHKVTCQRTMALTTPVARAPRLASAPSRASASHTRARPIARASASPDASTCARRRALALGFAALSLAVPTARAADLADAQAKKEARKKALRAAAEASAKSGRGEAAFADAEYGVSEEARTPNSHSRQEEGLKSALANNA